MTIRPTLQAIFEKRPASAGRLRLYARNVDLAVTAAGSTDLVGYKLVIDPAIPADRLLVKNNQGETLSTIILPGKG